MTYGGERQKLCSRKVHGVAAGAARAVAATISFSHNIFFKAPVSTTSSNIHHASIVTHAPSIPLTTIGSWTPAAPYWSGTAESYDDIARRGKEGDRSHIEWCQQGERCKRGTVPARITTEQMSMTRK